MTKRKKGDVKKTSQTLEKSPRKPETQNQREDVQAVKTTTSISKKPTSSLRLLYLTVALFRLLWTLFGQSGYVHPDEFFQSPEVVAGDVYDFAVERTWEFKEERPIRTMLTPFLTVGLPFYALRELNDVVTKLGGPNLISSSSLLLASRLPFCLLSFVIDVCLWKMASLCHASRLATLATFGTSYIALVFYVRSLSNALEAVFFACLLYVVLASTKVDSASKGSTSSTTDSLRISILIVAGFFNRPTFLAFAFVPVLFWLLRGRFSIRRETPFEVLLRAAALLPGAFVAASGFVAFDTLYYGAVGLDQMYSLWERPCDVATTLLPHLVWTPLNFLKYNLDPSNLATHGAHPFYVHIFNSVLLYGALGVSVVATLAFRRFSGNASASSHVTDMLTASYLFPLAFLSFFAHQEPRFLIPLLTPLCLLHSDYVFGPRSLSALTATWLFWGVAGSLLFGVFHQGGVIPSLEVASSMLKLGSLESPVRIVYYKTYMPPRHLLALPRTPTNGDFADVQVQDAKGCFTSLIETLRRAREDGADPILVTPFGVARGLFCACDENDIDVIKIIFPHLSMETPPRWKDISFSNGSDSGSTCHEKDLQLTFDYFTNFKSSLSLIMLRIRKSCLV